MSENKLVASININGYNNDNDNYPGFGESIKNRFNEVTADVVSLFKTNAVGLFDAFLNGLPPEARQHYNCDSCRRFVNRYGGLVLISDAGEVTSVFWEILETPKFFADSVAAMRRIVLKSKITGVFLTSKDVLGVPVTGDWEHMSVELPKRMISFSNDLANQQMSLKVQHFQMLNLALSEYSMDTIDRAMAILTAKSVAMWHEFLPIVKYFKSLHERYHGTKNERKRDAIVWLTAATAPLGVCKIRGSVVGTLLDSIAEGDEFNVIKRKFEEKVDPLHYQRPQTPPPVGNVLRAEQIVEEKGIKNSLERRFARRDELKMIWTPKEIEKPSKGDGVFSHLIPDQTKPTINMDLPPVPMTWVKFFEEVLPTADKIEFIARHRKDMFTAFLTALHPDAPPILKWDTENQRNPVSPYMHAEGSPPHIWGLSLGHVNVTGVCFHPAMWYGNFEHEGKSVTFILEGAKDTAYQGNGNALFPGILKGDLWEIRRTIEAHSAQATIHGYEESSACGVTLPYGMTWNHDFRVTTGSTSVTYKLDRWE